MRFDSGEEATLPIGDLVTPQRLMLGQRVLAPRHPGGYGVPGTVSGYGMVASASSEGYHITFDKDKRYGGAANDNESVLVAPADLAVPCFDKEALASMEGAHGYVGVAAPSRDAHLLDTAMEETEEADESPPDADGHTGNASKDTARDVSTLEAMSVPPKVDTVDASQRSYCAVCRRSSLPGHPLRSCACQRAFHERCVTAPWRASDARSDCPMCISLPSRTAAVVGTSAMINTADPSSTHLTHYQLPSIKSEPMDMSDYGSESHARRQRRGSDDDYTYDGGGGASSLFDLPEPEQRKRPKKSAWTPEEITLLKLMNSQGRTPQEMSEELGTRTVAAVNVRLWLIKNKKA